MRFAGEDFDWPSWPPLTERERVPARCVAITQRPAHAAPRHTGLSNTGDVRSLSTGWSASANNDYA